MLGRSSICSFMITMRYLSIIISDSVSYCLTLCAVTQLRCCYVEGRRSLPIRPRKSKEAAGGTGVQEKVSPSIHSPRGPAAVNPSGVQSQAATVEVAVLLLPDVYLVFSPDLALAL